MSCLVNSMAFSAAAEPAILPLVCLHRYSRLLYAVLSVRASSKTEDKTLAGSCAFNKCEIRNSIKTTVILCTSQLLDIYLSILCMSFNKLSARWNLVAHKHREYMISLSSAI